MAVVVSARSPVSDAQAGLVEPLLSGARPRGIVAWLATLSAVGSALALIAEGSARSAPAVAWLSTAALAVDALAALLALSACGAMWLARRDDAGPLLAVTLAVVLLPVRAVSAAVLLSLDMAILAEIASLGLGFLGLGCLVWAAAASLLATTVARAGTPQAELFRRVAEVTALIVFGVGISGVTVRAVGASWACGGGFPDCNGLGALPLGREPLADLQLYHRLLAYVALALVVWLGWQGGPLSPTAWTVALVAVAAGLGLAMVYRHRDGVYAGVIVWALAGIAVDHALGAFPNFFLNEVEK